MWLQHKESKHHLELPGVVERVYYQKEEVV